MRSSWLASATNWRTCSSDSWRAASAASTCPSIRLIAPPTLPTSVSGWAYGTRSLMLTSPLSRGSSDTRVAVSATLVRGRSPRRTRTSAAAAASSSPIAPTAPSTAPYHATVVPTAAVGSAVTTLPSVVVVDTAR